MTQDHRRVTITIDIIDEPGNDTTAVGALLDVIGHLQHDSIYPILIRLELGPVPATS